MSDGQVCDKVGANGDCVQIARALKCVLYRTCSLCAQIARVRPCQLLHDDIETAREIKPVCVIGVSVSHRQRVCVRACVCVRAHH